MAAREIECPDCGKRLSAGTTACPRCGSPMLGTMTLNDLMHDESFNPSRFDLRKLRWPHLLIATTLVTGIILLSAWPDFMHDRAPVDHDMPLIILGVVIAIGLLFGIPAGIYVLIRRLCRRRRRE